MKYQITSDNIEISDSMVALAKQKLSKLEPKLAGAPEELKSVRAVLNSAPLEKFEVKLELTLGKKKFFAEEIDFALETALIAATEDLDRQLEKLRTSDERGWEAQRELKGHGE